MADIRGRLAEMLGPILGELAPEEQPAFVAFAERIAAERYRDWATQVKDGAAREKLLACAAREDKIAASVEAVTDGFESIQARVQAEHPGVADSYKSLFARLSLRDQFASQAIAERTGAATWRSFAAGTTRQGIAALYETCAKLEEESADVLDELIAAGHAG